MIIILARAISWFAELITLALVARAVLSWFGQNPYSGIGKVYQFMVKVTEPIIAPARMILQRFNLNTGMLDLSVILAFFMVRIVSQLLIRILLMFAI